MRREFEINGCIEVPMELSEDEFLDKFIDFVEASNWYFGGTYLTIMGTIKRIDEYGRTILMKDGDLISIDEIIKIEGNILKTTKLP